MGSAEGRQKHRSEGWLREFSVFSGVYPPAEDTWLLLDYVEFLGSMGKLRGAKFLEVGCGSGVVSIRAAMLGADVLSVDINPIAVENTLYNAERLGVKLEARVSDIFSNVSGLFDVIVFNPPYLPGDPGQPASDPAWSGGREMGVVKRFFRDVPKYISGEGVFGIVLSSLSNVDSLVDYAEAFGIRMTRWAARRLFFEEISLWEGKSCR